MEIILLRSYNKLGKSGDVVEVKNGYARNFLFPHSLALPATVSNRASFEARKKTILAKRESSDLLFNDVAEKISGTTFFFVEKASDEGKLFGSINNKRIAATLQDKITKGLQMSNFKVDHLDLSISQQIKHCGLFTVTYGQDNSFKFFVSVGRTMAEAEHNVQAQSSYESPSDDVTQDIGPRGLTPAGSPPTPGISLEASQEGAI